MHVDDFERIVAEAIDALPEFIHAKLENVEITLEEWPDRETLRTTKTHHKSQLLGFYHGVPQTRRTRHYGLVLPDKITIYRRPIEIRCRTEEEVRNLVYHVLVHEIAHHFGIDDDRLRELGAY